MTAPTASKRSPTARPRRWTSIRRARAGTNQHRSLLRSLVPAIIHVGFALWGLLRPCAPLNQPTCMILPAPLKVGRPRLRCQTLRNCWVSGPMVLASLRGSWVPGALLELFLHLLCSSPRTCRQVLLRPSSRCRRLFPGASSTSLLQSLPE